MTGNPSRRPRRYILTFGVPIGTAITPIQNEKRERIEVDKKREKVRFIPGKEDSFDRLTEIGIEFPDKGTSVSDQAIQKIIVEQALAKLTADERYIIVNIYFNERTERELAKELGKTQQAISKSKARILLKLHEILK